MVDHQEMNELAQRKSTDRESRKEIRTEAHRDETPAGRRKAYAARVTNPV
ncbi:hypothetical protein ACFU53_34640 [Streptomyces sp. NPDC057474]